MKHRRKLADKVMGFLNSHTQWNFQVWKDGSSYIVGTLCENEKGQMMDIHYAIHKGSAQLFVIVNDCECTEDFVQGKIFSEKLGFPLFTKELAETTVAIGTPISLEDLDNGMHIIASERMDAMVQLMTEILNNNGRREFQAMKNRRKLANKVMEYVNAFTHWNFQIWTNGESYDVKSTIFNKKGQGMSILYEIQEDGAKLLFIADGCKFDPAFVQEKIKAAELGFPVHAKEVDGSDAIETSISLEDLDNEAHIIIREKMTAMLQVMSDIIHEKTE